MSAIQIRCDRCGGLFIAGMVGITLWPAHVCPDGTKGAPASLTSFVVEQPPTGTVDALSAGLSGYNT